MPASPKRLQRILNPLASTTRRRWTAPLAVGVLGLGSVVGFGLAGATPALGDNDNPFRGADAMNAHTGDLIDVGGAAGDFKTLGAALEAAGLIDALRADGPFTVLAPTDAAFAALPEGVVATLLKPENKALLTSVLTYHVVPGRVLAAQAAGAEQAETLNGADVSFAIDAGRLEVNGVNIVATDVLATNGVIHAIDAVLLPPDFELPAAKSESKQPSPQEVVDLAIRRGVPLFNRGQAEACAAIYEVALLALTAHPEVSDSQRAMIQRTLSDGREHHDDKGRAWAFRRGLDAARSSIMAAR